MNPRIQVLTKLGFREQVRRPLLLVLLVGLPFFFITRSIAATENDPRTIILPGGAEFLTNMRDLHGASMAAITVAFLAGLCGAFIMRSSHEIDRRLVVAGFRPIEAIIPRFIVLAAAASIVVAASVAVTAISFAPESWTWFLIGSLLIGLTYACIGAIAGAALGELGATYLILFFAMLGMGILQNPMFGTGSPSNLARLFPDYGASRVIIDGCFGTGFQAWTPMLIAVAWLVLLACIVVAGMRRSFTISG